MHPRMRLVVAIVVASAAVSTCQGWDPGYDCSAEGQTGLYEKRIAPLFEQDSPSSCNQCRCALIAPAPSAPPHSAKTVRGLSVKL